MKWDEFQGHLDRIYQAMGVSVPSIDDRRREHVREKRRDRQRRHRERVREARKRAKLEAEVLTEAAKLEASFPPPPEEMPIHIVDYAAPAQRRHHSRWKRVWRVEFTGRALVAKPLPAKQLDGRARGADGRFERAKTQPLPGHRAGCQYETKGWHIRACLLRSVRAMTVGEVATACGRHRTSVWRCLNRPEIIGLSRALHECRLSLVFGKPFSIDVPLDRRTR